MARWQVRLVVSAERDVGSIIDYTLETYGSKQAKTYERTLTLAFIALQAGPNLRDSTPREALAPGVRSLHVARNGRRGRHLVIYRERPGRIIEVLRILHDAMDLGRHLPTLEP